MEWIQTIHAAIQLEKQAWRENEEKTDYGIVAFISCRVIKNKERKQTNGAKKKKKEKKKKTNEYKPIKRADRSARSAYSSVVTVTPSLKGLTFCFLEKSHRSFMLWIIAQIIIIQPEFTRGAMIRHKFP